MKNYKKQSFPHGNLYAVQEEAEKLYEAEEKLQKLLKEKKSSFRRIIFWYDESKMYQEEVENYQLETCKVIKVTDQNLVWTKHQIEKVYPCESFLLYFDTTRPHDLANPLIDIYLYGEEFKMDAMATLMDEIGMNDFDSELFFQQHTNFFQSKKRQKEFLELTRQEESLTIPDLFLAVYCVLARVKERSLSVLCEQLFWEESEGKIDTWKQIEKFSYPSNFWEMVEVKYHYQAATPSIQDFLMSLFVTKLSVELEGEIPANWNKWNLEPKNNSVVFLNRWMNHVSGKKSYTIVSEYVAKELKIPKFLKRKPIEFVIKSDSFREMDDYISETIAESICSPTVQYGQLEQTILSRRNSFWQDDYSITYQMLLAAVRLLKGITDWEKHTRTTDLDFLWSAYQTYFFQIDQYYRQFYVFYDQLEQTDEMFHALRDKIENYYKNGFLNDFSEKWSEAIGDSDQIRLSDTTKQNDFYKDYVEPFVKEQKRVFVIISDALRYEIGEELARELGDSHYYTVETKAMQGVVPSYTALGMASLLPHDHLSYKESQVLVDGQPAQGLENRSRILQSKFGEDKAKAFHARDILQMTKIEMREAFSGGLVFYIYHNSIDAMGDHAATEDRVFSGVELAKEEIRKLADKLVNNVSAANLIVTADHGFIYTRNPLLKVDKLSAPITQSIVNSRRFYVDDDPSQQEGTHTFKIDSIDSPKMFVHIPKGTMRLAISGSGDKFVHGGSLPQEIMIPVLKIKAEMGRDMRKKVGIQLISELNRITNVVTYLSFLQVQKVTHDTLPRTVRAYFADAEDNLISNEVFLRAESTSDSPQERILKEKFIFANKEYHSLAEYYFIMEDDSTKEIVEKRQFTIDLFYIE